MNMLVSWMRKTIRIDNSLDRLVEVLRAKTLIDRREKITYTSTLNLILLIGLYSYLDSKDWSDVFDQLEDQSPDEFFTDLEERIRGEEIPEDFLSLEIFLYEEEEQSGE